MLVAGAVFWGMPQLAVGHDSIDPLSEPWGAMYGTPISASHVTIEAQAYRGWPSALRIGNGRVEAIVVPAIGRVMRFDWVGESQNMFWENAALDGSTGAPADGAWGNFGGDKVWPSPQSDWPQIAGRAWPPPSVFDSLPFTAKTTGDSIVLTSAVDPHYGIQTVRRISLSADSPVMTISTEFHKVAGTPVRVGVWSITQVPDAERVYALLPVHSAMREGYVRLSEAAPASFRISGRLLSLTRNKVENVKIGMDGRSLLWVGEKNVLRIDTAAGDGEFPDKDSRTAIYTNADPVAYFELETMGPLINMKAADVTAWSSTYTLMRRTESTSDAEAAKVFGVTSSKQ